MPEFTPWLGLCHLRQLADDRTNAQPTLTTVWADSVESFEREVHVHTNSHGLQMIWSEDVMPADEWLEKHPDRKDGQRLADKVSQAHPVEIGGFGVGTTGLGSDGVPDDEAEGYLHIEEIEGVEPLDNQFGVHPPKTVPDALYEPLFGQPEPSAAEVEQYGGADKVPPLNTYAILGAAKVVNFVEMLEASGLEHRCLFKGEAAQEMRDVAPYVVQLEEDVDFTRNLFSKDPDEDVPWFMWDKEPGIYIRSRGSLDDMWKHFRKFTKVQDEDGKWFYFRFWEGEVLNTILAISVTLTVQFFKLPNLPEIITRLDSRLSKIRLSVRCNLPVKPFVLTEKILGVLDSDVRRHNLQADTQHVMICLNIKDTEEVGKRFKNFCGDRNWLIEKGFSDKGMLRKVLVICTKVGGIDKLPDTARKILSDERTGPNARLWLLEKNMKED